MEIQVRDPELTPEEEAKPYSKYFYKELTPPAPGALEKMEKPMDPAKALPIEELNKMLDPGYHEVEAGWCALPQGGLYVANLLKMHGVTVEMVDWWFGWHGLEDLRYKIWFPPGHFGVSMSDRHRAIVLDPNTPPKKKFQGITHYVLEDTNGPSVEKIAISFMTPEDVGFDMDRFKSPNIGTLVAANGSAKMLNPPPGIPDQKSAAFMMHFVRETPDGVEFRTRFWMGYHILNKKPHYCLPKTAKLPEIVAKGLAMHNVEEYTNLASFLPQIYEEQKGMIP